MQAVVRDLTDQTARETAYRQLRTDADILLQERDRKAAALEQLHAEQDILLDTANVGLAHVHDGRWVWVNQALADTLGCEPFALQGQPISQLQADPVAAAALKAHMHAHFAAGHTVLQTELCLTPVDGIERWFETRISLRDPIHFTAMLALRDITHERQQSQRLEAALQEAQSANKS